MHGIQLQEVECVSSFDVSSLFASVPTDPAINILKRKLKQDQELHLRTSMTVDHIISLLEHCLKTTYFQFQGRYFEQIQETAMGSPISPTVANLYMKEFKIRAINTAVPPPRMWKRYVNDTFVVTKTSCKEEFLECLNSLDPPHFQFTSEPSREDGSKPFLDISLVPQPEKSLITTVYRKPTYPNLYLKLGSHHNMVAKYNVINILTHRAKTVCSNP